MYITFNLILNQHETKLPCPNLTESSLYYSM